MLSTLPVTRAAILNTESALRLLALDLPEPLHELADLGSSEAGFIGQFFERRP